MAINLLGSNNANLDFGDLSSLPGATALTVAITFTGTAAEQWLVSQWGSLSNQQCFVCTGWGTDDIQVLVSDGSRSSALYGGYTTDASLSTGTYRCVFRVWGLGGTQGFDIWVNGVQPSVTTRFSGTIASLYNPATSVCMGHQPSEPFDGVDADYAELMIWTEKVPDHVARAYGLGHIPRWYKTANSVLYLPCWTTSHLTDLWNGFVATNNSGTTAAHPPVFYGARARIARVGTTATAVTRSPSAGGLILGGGTPSAPTARVCAPSAGAVRLAGATAASLTTQQPAPSRGAVVFAGAVAASLVACLSAPTAGALQVTGAAPTVAVAVQAAPSAGAVVLAGTTTTPVLTWQVPPTVGAVQIAGGTPTAARVNAWWRPQVLTLTKGAIVSGALRDVDVEDSTYLVLSEVTGAGPAFSYDFTFWDLPATDGPQSIHIHGRYTGNVGHRVKLQQYNYSTLGWEDLTSNTTDLHSNTVDEAYSFPLLGYTGNYVSGGQLALRITHTSAGIATHELYLDYLALDTNFAVVPQTSALVLAGGTSSPLVAHLVTPTAGALVLSGGTLAPNVGVSPAPPTGALVLAGGTSSALLAVLAAPTAGSLVVTGQTPSALVAALSAPTVGAVQIAGTVPVAAVGQVVTPSEGLIILDGLRGDEGVMPVAVLGVVAQPTTGALILAGGTPGPGIPWTASPTAGAVVLAGGTLTLREGANLTPTAGAVVVAGATSTVVLALVVAPSPGTLVLAGTTSTPTLSWQVPPTAGAVVLAGTTPSAPLAVRVTPTAGAVVLGGGTVSAPLARLTTPTAGAVVLTGRAADLLMGLTIAPPRGAVVLMGRAVAPYILHTPDTEDIWTLPARADTWTPPVRADIWTPARRDDTWTVE